MAAAVGPKHRFSESPVCGLRFFLKLSTPGAAVLILGVPKEQKLGFDPIDVPARF